MTTPGEALRDACRTSPYLTRHTAAELALRTGYTPKHISEVFSDKARISLRMALDLEFVLQLPASMISRSRASLRKSDAVHLQRTWVAIPGRQTSDVESADESHLDNRRLASRSPVDHEVSA